MGKVNNDLRRERAKCTFDVKELTVLYDGGEENTRQRRAREDVMFSRREFELGTPEDYLGHKEKYEDSIRKSVIIFGHVRRMQDEGRTNINDYRHVLECLLGTSTVRDGSSFAIHYIMFMPAIMSQGTEEQQAYWLPRAWNNRILGTYAQTELGHGTFIRGLEATATYDPDTEEFVLNTPTLTSYKWWPGGIGHTANYCVVIAQLYTKGDCHGVHPFIVQLRDEESHEPLPGVTVGDIGGKLGLQPVNNGFLALDNVRIPRNHMLMKHAQVLKNGTYVKSSSNRMLYAAMVFVRVVILYDTVNYLSKAVTIATRYSAVRRQTPLKESGPELQILDYLTQQHKLFISIATCYAFRIIANKQWSIYYEVNEEVSNGIVTRLPELHALTCCLKAVMTSDAAQSAERCRLSCGGHGYSLSSNLPQLYGQLTAACTYEGENTVLLLQTARFLLKTWQKREDQTLTPSVAYMRTASAVGFLGNWENSVEGIVRGFQVVALKKIANCAEVIEKRLASGMALEDSWNMTSVQLVAAAETHSRLVIMTTFHEGVSRMMTTASTAVQVVLQQILELYVTYWALEKLVDLLKYTSISKSEADALQARYEELLAELRPNAIGLVEAFDIRDEMLQSTLGAHDGRVYERLMEEALKNPLNQDRVNHTYQTHLKPYMLGKL